MAPQHAAIDEARSKVVLDFALEALRCGDIPEARRLLHQRLAENPADTLALAKLAEIAVDLREIEQATILLRRAANIDPTALSRVNLIRHLQNFVGAAAALEEIESWPLDLRSTFEIEALEAAQLGVLGMHDRQIQIYEDLVRRFPRVESLWMSLGNALKTVGRIDEAVHALRNAIEVRATFGEGYWTLANFKSVRFTDRDLSAMRKALKKKLAPEDALHFHFALGKALEERDNYEQSFRHYEAGNRLRAAGFEPAEMGNGTFVDRAVSTLTEDFFLSRVGSGCRAPDPIFVLGLHRSGSTLIEQILASHRLIEGTTEITVMQQLWDRLARAGARNGRGPFLELASLDRDQLRALGEEYLERTRAFRLTDRPLFVDKLPANWMHFGLIRLILPNAKIVDARRHPLACGFSNFKQNYASGMAFSYSLNAIGSFYHDYWRFMMHVDRVQPGAVHRVINEQVIDDPEREIRRLLEFVGVPFDPACLEFHSNARAVRTPSAEQVRRPINRAGADSWRPYERWLTPLKEALGPALTRWDLS